MKLSKIFERTTLNESDVLKHNPELKNLLIQDVPMLMKKANEDLRGDRYDSLVKDLASLSQAVERAKQLLQQTMQTQGNKIKNKEQGQSSVKPQHVFSIKDKEV